jgi:hypothetical protein
MGFHDHLKKLAGMPVREWGAEFDWQELADAEAEAEAGEGQAPKFPPIRSPETTVFRIALDYEDEDAVTWQEKFDRFLAQKNADRVAGLVVGSWSPDDPSASSAAVVKAITKAARRLPNLRAVFLGDITGEESEVSWITQCDVGPLLAAYPLLEYLGVRGGTSLKFQVPRHDRLKTLVIESGGLSRKLVHQVIRAELPALEHLELWLGTQDYGADTTPEDLAALLAGKRFPKLKYLGLRNSEMADDIAAVLAGAPVLKKLKTLDLSLGTLTDAGARALLGSKGVKRLEKLDVHHHYCSKPVVKQLKALGPQVDAGKVREPFDFGGGETARFVSVGE